MTKIIVEMEKIKGMYYGLGQFCYHLGTHLLKFTSPPLDLHFYLPKEQLNIFSGQNNTHTLKEIHKKVKFITPKSDIWHATHQDSPFFPASNKSKYIVTIHDLNFLIEKKDDKKAQKKHLNALQKKVDRADALVFISNFSKKTAQCHLSIPDIPTPVIYNGVALEAFTAPEKPVFAPDCKFLFSIGTVTPKRISMF